jgi:phosphoribulokinase
MKYTIVIFKQLDIKKNQINKDNFRKYKKKRKEKKYAGKHCSNLECFMRKSTVVIFNQLNIKNNKIDKDNFEKNHNKNNHGETLEESTVFKKKNCKAKFSSSSV